MIEKFKTLFFVKSSLISLYLALTLPIPLIASENLKLLPTIIFLIGLFLIIDITNDNVETSDEKIVYKTSFFARILGKKSWEIYWKDITSLKSLPTSQGSKVYYFITCKDKSFLVPQRIDNFERFIQIISKKTNLNTVGLSHISPIWTYKILTYISLFMIVGEIISFVF